MCGSETPAPGVQLTGMPYVLRFLAQNIEGAGVVLTEGSRRVGMRRRVIGVKLLRRHMALRSGAVDRELLRACRSTDEVRMGPVKVCLGSVRLELRWRRVITAAGRLTRGGNP